MTDAQPSYFYSMPTQLSVLFIIVTLLVILLIQLLFTVRYHIPLSKLNYALQTTAVVLTLSSTLASVNILTQQLIKDSSVPPYTFKYIEYAIPGSTLFSRSGLIAWTTSQAIVTISVHASQIQFLTLLFPSTLENKLILLSLGPIALASSMMNFSELASSAAIVDLGEAVRDTANSTLSLLYTLSLLIWGLLINRARAWRTDGGTAAFGAIAMILGVLGTAVNFLEINEDRMKWLSNVIKCIQLWQSWVGLWWWVGAGMWSGEAEDVERKEVALQLRKEKKARRVVRMRERKEREKTLQRRLVSVGNDGQLDSAAAVSATEGTSLHTTISRSSSSFSTDSSSTFATTLDGFFTPLLSFFHPLFAVLRTAHNEATIFRAAKPGFRERWGPSKLRAHPDRSSPATIPLEVEQVDSEEIATEPDAAGVGRVEEGEWEDEVDTGSPAGGERRENDDSEQWQGRGMDGQQSWTWRGRFAKWRLKDVSTYD